MFVRVYVVPGSRRERVTKVNETEFEIAVKEPAERNLANGRIRAILAQEFEISLAQVRLLTGHRSSSKLFSIDV